MAGWDSVDESSGNHSYSWGIAEGSSSSGYVGLRRLLQSPDPALVPSPRLGGQSRRNGAPTAILADQIGELTVDGAQTPATVVASFGIDFEANADVAVEVRGHSVPPPADSFDGVAESAAVKDNVERCGYKKPTPVQRYAMPICLGGRDLMACAQTGSGKTAAFCFPVIACLLRKAASEFSSSYNITCYPSALILSPTRELTVQIHTEAKKFTYNTRLKVAVVYGGASVRAQMRDLDRGVDILVATPGRLIDFLDRGKVALCEVKHLVLDEADRMLDMGFEPAIRRIVQESDMPAPGMRQTMLFSATFPQQIQRLAEEFLHNYIFVAVGRVGSSTDLITQHVEFVNELDKKRKLLEIIKSHEFEGSNGSKKLIVVFVGTKRRADELEDWLYNKGFNATSIHGDRTQDEREYALKSFKSGKAPILVATDVVARGLDISDVAHVINYDMPNDIDSYVHRIGRTGRAGRTGIATAFFCEKNEPLAKALLDVIQESNQDVPPWLSELANSQRSYGSRQGQGHSGKRFNNRWGNSSRRW